MLLQGAKFHSLYTRVNDTLLKLFWTVCCCFLELSPFLPFEWTLFGMISMWRNRTIECASYSLNSMGYSCMTTLAGIERITSKGRTQTLGPIHPWQSQSHSIPASVVTRVTHHVGTQPYRDYECKNLHLQDRGTECIYIHTYICVHTFVDCAHVSCVCACVHVYIKYFTLTSESILMSKYVAKSINQSNNWLQEVLAT